MSNNYAYVFSCGGKVVWSGENSTTLVNRANSSDDRNLILDFLESKPSPGSFIVLNEGDLIFKICEE